MVKPKALIVLSDLGQVRYLSLVMLLVENDFYWQIGVNHSVDVGQSKYQFISTYLKRLFV